MNTRISTYLFIVSMLVISISCQKSDEGASQGSEVINLGVQEAAELIAAGDITVLDVRTKAEYESGHIEGATQLDFRGVNFKAGIAALDHSKTYLVHCASGRRSSQAVKILAAVSPNKIYHLEGGINAWVKGDQALVR